MKINLFITLNTGNKFTNNTTNMTKAISKKVNVKHADNSAMHDTLSDITSVHNFGHCLRLWPWTALEETISQFVETVTQK